MPRVGDRLPFATVVVTVALAHLALLAGEGRPDGASGAAWRPSMSTGADVHDGAAPLAWRVRTLALTDTTPSEQTGSEKAMVKPGAPVPDARPISPPAPAHQVTPPPPPSPAGTGAYLPRHRLTVGPQPQTPIVIGYPAQVDHAGRLSGRLAVYIDEHGTVRRVEPLDDNLPAPALDAARTAFMAATFSPGQRDGQAVRARIEIEVNFEADP